MENRYKTMITDKFDYGFAVDWMKRFINAMEEAKNNGSSLPVTEL